MTSVRAITALQLLACLLVTCARCQQEIGTRSSGTDRDTKTQALTLPLDSMDELEVQGIADTGAEPYEMKRLAPGSRRRGVIASVAVKKNMAQSPVS